MTGAPPRLSRRQACGLRACGHADYGRNARRPFPDRSVICQ
jgi:hypothetical protein